MESRSEVYLKLTRVVDHVKCCLCSRKFVRHRGEIVCSLFQIIIRIGIFDDLCSLVSVGNPFLGKEGGHLGELFLSLTQLGDVYQHLIHCHPKFRDHCADIEAVDGMLDLADPGLDPTLFLLCLQIVIYRSCRLEILVYSRRETVAFHFFCPQDFQIFIQFSQYFCCFCTCINHCSSPDSHCRRPINSRMLFPTESRPSVMVPVLSLL